MAYEPVQNRKGPYVRLEEDIELSMQYNSGSYRNTPLPNNTQDRDGKARVEDTREGFLSNEVPLGQWPSNSERMTTVTLWKALVILFDVILASTPIMFIALASSAARIDGEELSYYGLRLEETLRLSPTIFPLIFAALMGRFFRYLSLWLAQQGTTLGLLEQLVGCQSVFSALERQIGLRSWSAVGLASTLVWLLSPLGGQSALRLLGTETGTAHSVGQMGYLSPATIMDSFMSGASSVNSGRSTFTPVFVGALLSSNEFQSWPKDLWGNTKLPIYRQIDNSSLDEWKLLPEDFSDSNISFASLLGIPIVSTNNRFLESYTVKARQWDFTCFSNRIVTQERAESDRNYTWQMKVYDSTQPDCVNTTNCTFSGYCSGYPCPIRSESLASSGVSIADCNLSLGHYESEVLCDAWICSVHRMRKLDLFDEYYSRSDDDELRKVSVANQLIHLPIMDAYNVRFPVLRGSTTMEKWIYDPSNVIGVGSKYVDLGELSPDIFAERLTVLYNTFWQSTYGTRTLGGNLPMSILQTGRLDAAESGPNISFVASEAKFVDYGNPVYKVSWKWFTVLFICSMILLAAAYTGLVLKHITIAPDIIGYASSLTIMNPYLLTPTGGTTLHGLQRSALLRELPVRIGDVCPNDPVGAIAFAKNDVGRVAALDRNRRYI
ncbi:hypothetical protein PTNB73_04601 [Pyrenophora teres f. teres]|uniref:Uncharacterized protein n=1 Tax=Pyrenophora teres f. teres (strain 0-1) TaxID=861557 RepID=E3S735_PYRTT|nr:hypothetical protein PTT_18601 [Pyrenophora teres f. teres 0-1]KAE8840195.1 hypothetical protein HRS9122_06800 [Pyrenophora teres f. teres]KAE8869548.1 hypothetical protein PTNB73_04601 [Pyrenophora teres f. teres]